MKTLPRLVLVASLALVVAACGEKPAEAPKSGGPVGGNAAPAAGDPAARATAAYDKGLDFLAAQQKDGVWSAQGKPHVGITAMSVTPFLERAGGMRPSDKAIVDKAIPWIASELGPDGGIKAEFSSNYETSVVVMALAATKDAKWKPAIEKAAAYIKSLQFPESDPSYGGIGYGDDGPVGDLSNTQYALAALDAAGVPHSDPVYQEALVFAQRAQNRKENESPGEPKEWKDKDGKKVVRGNDGGAAYAPGNGEHTGFDTAPDGSLVLKSYASMTYALLRCYHLAGLGKDDGRMKAAVEWISKHWALDRNPGMPEDQKRSGLYYYYASIGKTLPALGIDHLTAPDGRKVDWRAELSAALLAEQAADGSWKNAGPRWWESDPVLATGYALTALRPCIK